MTSPWSSSSLYCFSANALITHLHLPRTHTTTTHTHTRTRALFRSSLLSSTLLFFPSSISPLSFLLPLSLALSLSRSLARSLALPLSLPHINLKTQYHLCRRGECTCECDPCAAVDYAYCYMCEQKGRIYMKRAACVNKSCVAQRAAMPNLAAPPPPPHAPPSPALPPAAAVAPANPAGFVLQPGPVAPSALTGSS